MPGAHWLYLNSHTQQQQITWTYFCNWAPHVSRNDRRCEVLHRAVWNAVQTQSHWGSQQWHDPRPDPEYYTQQKVCRTPWTTKYIVTGQAQPHMAANDILPASILCWLEFISKIQISDHKLVGYTFAPPNTRRNMEGHQLHSNPRVTVV